MIVARERMIVCGIKLIPLIAEAFGAGEVVLVKVLTMDPKLNRANRIGTDQSASKDSLDQERTALNFLQKLCGIATLTKAFRQPDRRARGKGFLTLAKPLRGSGLWKNTQRDAEGDTTTGWDSMIEFWPRTIIWLRPKWTAPASLKIQLRDLKKSRPGFLVEVEVDDLDQLDAVLQGGADAVLLDNFSPDDIVKAVNLNLDQAILEASGGIHEKNISLYAQAKPHFISTSPVHASRWLDLGLDWIQSRN